MTESAIDFRSDNCGRAAPELIEAIVSANIGTALGYGGDALTASLQRLARQANGAATAVAAQIKSLVGVTLVAPVQANELFVDMAPAALSGVENDGILFYRRGPRLGRFVCRWDTSENDIARLAASIRLHAAAAHS